MFGIPEDSIRWPFLFNIFICEYFLFTNNIDIASYADDNTPCVTSSNTNLAIEKLKQYSDSLFTWFLNNGNKAKADKCHFLLSTKVCRINNVANNNKFKIKINEINSESSPQEKLLGIILDDDHVSYKTRNQPKPPTTSQNLQKVCTDF